MPIMAHKRDLQTDGRAATILAGYGAYDMPSSRFDLT
jgi:protease II